MRGEDDLPPGFADKPNGRERKKDTGIIRDVILLVLGNVEIDSNKYTLPFQSNLINGADGHYLLPLMSSFCSSG
jgi:hypothetical protein